MVVREMKKRFYINENKKPLLIYLINELLKTWEFGIPSDKNDDFLEEIGEIEGALSDVFRSEVSRMFPSIADEDFYYYLFNLYTTRLPYSMRFENHPNLDIFHDKNEIKESFVEVIESDKTVSITVELPEFLKENIELEITKNILVIYVNQDKKRYFKKVEFPSQVDADSAIASYQNGILDIELKKVKSGNRKEILKLIKFNP